MAKYQCSICGWVYDESKGLPPRIEPNTRFEEISDNFKCPKCNANKGYINNKI